MLPLHLKRLFLEAFVRPSVKLSQGGEKTRTLDPIGPQHCVVPECTSASGVLVGLLLGSEGDLANTSLMMSEVE